MFSSTGGRIEGSTATFGAPYFGDRVLGRVVWGDSKRNHSHCRRDDYDTPQQDPLAMWEHPNEPQLINIVMVRRGQCSFVRKVLVAQESKEAHAVIIVDKEDSTMTSKDLKNIIVADDGYGSGVHIPSVLISKDDGRKLIDAAKANEVVVELEWNIPTNHYVQVDLWMSSASPETQRFLKDFGPMRKALNYWVKFVPHFAVFGMASGMDYNDLCTDTSAQFCAEDPDGDGLITGKMVLDEDVRQLCIHELTKSPTPVGHDVAGMHPLGSRPYSEKFWTYVELFGETCSLHGKDEGSRFGIECAERLMTTVGIDVGPVQDCMSRTKYAKLKHERDNRAWSPRAMRVNGWRYSGAMHADLVTRAICAGFVTEPSECKLLLTPRNPFEHYNPKPVKADMSIGAFVVVLLVCIVSTIVGMLLYQRGLKLSVHRQLREEVMLEVQAQMDTYRQLPS
jgi:hypothetical protein